MNAIRTVDKIPGVTNLRGIKLTNQLQFIWLFVNVSEMPKAYEDF